MPTLLHMYNVLDCINNYPSRKQDVIKRISDEMRIARKQKTKSEILNAGFDLYEKKNKQVTDVISELIEEEYLEEPTDEESFIKLSSKGKDFLIDCYTNNNSKEFQTYATEINKQLTENKEINLSISTLAKFFHKKLTVDHVIQKILTLTSFNNATKEYHNLQLQKEGHIINDDLFIFHFIPSIFVNMDQIKESVTLRIEGIEQPATLYMSKPYPNNRYTVSGCKYKNQKPSIGFYPIVVPRKDAPQKINIIMHWTVGSQKITHNIHFIFRQNENVMAFFSSNQSLMSPYPAFKDKDTFTVTDIHNSIWDERYAFVTLDQNHDIYISEIVELDNFPYHQDHSMLADKRFKDFLKPFLI